MAAWRLAKTTGSLCVGKEGPTNVVTLPLGPYHPALVQPFALAFKLRGETVDEVDPPQAGFCARNIEALACGRPVTQALALLERSCALAGHTHRTAACQAIEDALHIAPTHRANLLRAAFAEIERVLARLWMLGLSARAAEADTLWRAALEQRETLFAALYQVTGQRCYWAVAQPGGVRAFDPPLDGEALLSALAQLEPALVSWRAATSPYGWLGRAAMGVGILDGAGARALEVQGLTARGAGLDDGLRRDASDDAYAVVAKAWPAERELPELPARGDAASRLAAAAADLEISVRLASGLLEAARDAEDAPVVLDVVAPSVPPDGLVGSATREGPHGPVTVTLTLAPKDIVHALRLRTPLAGTWAALPEMLRGQPVARAPLIVASLDLCVECLDL